MPFANAITFGDDHAVGLINGAAHIRLQFGAMHFAIAMNGVDLAVIVKVYG